MPAESTAIAYGPVPVPVAPKIDDENSGVIFDTLSELKLAV